MSVNSQRRHPPERDCRLSFFVDSFNDESVISLPHFCPVVTFLGNDAARKKDRHLRGAACRAEAGSRRNEMPQQTAVSARKQRGACDSFTATGPREWESRVPIFPHDV